MFKIDFLKGHGLPTKSHPMDVAVVSVCAVVAVLVGCLLGIQYFANTSAIASKQKSLSMVEGLVESCSAETDSKGRIGVYEECYSEVAYSVRRYVKWTPVLREIAETLPSTMMLNALDASRTVSKEKVTSKFDPKKKVDVMIFSRRLKADIFDFAKDDDSILRQYLSGWRDSERVKGVFDDIFLSRSSDSEYEIDGKTHQVKNHIVDCMLVNRQIINKK